LKAEGEYDEKEGTENRCMRLTVLFFIIQNKEKA